MSVESNLVYEFGPFRVDTAERVLLREGAPVPLTPKAFDVLLLLVESHGRIVEKDEMMDRVWANSFVEEGNLKATVSMIRKALGEAAGRRNYIETIPRRGYRFRAEVSQSRSEDLTLMVQERTRSVVTIEEEQFHSANDDDSQEPVRGDESAQVANLNGALAATARRKTIVADSAATLGDHRIADSRTRLLPRSLQVFATAVIIMSAIGAWLYQSGKERPAGIFTGTKVAKLTNNGDTRYAAVSPDGRYVAHVTDDGGRQSLWVKLVATGNGVLQ